MKITYQPAQTREQILEMVRTMTKAAVEEYMQDKRVLSAGDSQKPDSPTGPSAQDLDTMLAGLKFFDT